jgi:glycerol-3-phosphate dehydrogenase (NAD(P)+)
MFKNISIIGDGAMGTVLASLLSSKGLNVRLWGYDKDQLEEMRQARENVKFLAGYPIAKNVIFDADDKTVMQNADLLVSAVPCQFIRQVFNRLKPYVPANTPIVSVTKGVEIETLLRPQQILKEVLGTEQKCVTLSGPTIADEIAQKLPATACSACEDMVLAKEVQVTFNTDYFRVYTNPDATGVELAGAMKNVIAIAAGIIDGIKAGDNAKAALLCRGLAEISRLGQALGANEKTFGGLTGLGDLVTTCFSPKGRNRSFGERIGAGQSVESALKATQSVIEGAATCKGVRKLAQKVNVEMPITQEVYSILFENKPVNLAIADLMQRELKPE